MHTTEKNVNKRLFLGSVKYFHWKSYLRIESGTAITDGRPDLPYLKTDIGRRCFPILRQMMKEVMFRE